MAGQLQMSVILSVILTIPNCWGFAAGSTDLGRRMIKIFISKRSKLQMVTKFDTITLQIPMILC
jgi:hypothetical protein